MADLSPALLTDLEFAVGRWGLTLDEVPRDHEGKSIQDRLAALVADGESWCGSSFRRQDLRSERANVWELFPENPATAREQCELMDEVGELLHREEQFRQGPTPSLILFSDLPRPEHMAALEQLLAYIDGTAPAPEVVEESWTDIGLFEQAADVVPPLRAAEEAVRVRAALVQELVSGQVPPVSAAIVRRALDSDEGGLRNADITLAGYQVKAQNLRDSVELAIERLRPHFLLAERIRQVRDDLNRIDDVLHWPGHWRQAPTLLSQTVPV